MDIVFFIYGCIHNTETEKIISQITFIRFNSRTITDIKTFRRELAAVRKLGYAVDRGEELTGIHCIGAPVLNRHGYPIGTIWTTGPTDRLAEGEFEAIGRLFKAKALAISQSLGYEPSP